MAEATTIAAEVTTPLTAIPQDGLTELAAKNKANPADKILKVKTVCTGKFRSLNYARDLDAFVIDEPPVLLGDNTAPNPSEIVLGAFGSCLVVGIQANAAAKGVTLTKLEIALEGDINIVSTWGTGELDKPQMGFTDVRVKVDIEGDADQAILEEMVAHANTWSPVSTTLSNPIPVSVEMA
ncbi:OsmC family protein [filamentous cyanobacterium LEGE 11480]|uniref:OsmC family protein n=1 Tax=Romeriopsis navalis LEGE 11480 TaxID=2777977 RepID=A0A928Z5E7_9CYAN|nr:OsmC family protein [Romeriopsis navalis]MBE9032749.1 OsmC family protein [Romeriopsis navalis LEGE 11480]